MKPKAQGAIEYLLIIGAAVIIAVIVIALMMGLAGQGTGAVEEAGVGSEYSKGLIQAKSCTKLPFIEDDYKKTVPARIPMNYSYYLGFSADQLMVEYDYAKPTGSRGTYIPNNIYIGKGPLIPKGTANDDAIIIDYLQRALEGGYMSVLINGKNALSQGYEIMVFENGEPDPAITDKKMIAIYYARDELYSWIVVDRSLYKNWGSDPSGQSYGTHEKATVELCYLDKPI